MKRLTVMTLFILLLAACNTSEDASPKKVEEVEQNETEEADDTDETLVEEEEIETEIEKKESNKEEVNTSTKEENTNSNTVEENKNNKPDETPEKEKEEKLIDLTYDIFAAQNNKDYTFLQSILSKGSTLDEKNNKFIFDNVTYPHEQEFLTEENAGELEMRYTHENDDGSVIVGFAAIDYEKEYSFVIDFVYIQEDGSWKMNDMEINK